MLRLYTFAISHFSEKARWALDLNGVTYTERRLLPGLHIPVVRRRAPKATVPLLEHEDSGSRVFVQGSSAVLDYLETRLGATRLAPPAATAARSVELEARADHAFGLGVQRILYDVLLDRPKVVIGLWTQGAPAWSRAMYRAVFPLLRRGTTKTYAIYPKKVDEAKERFRRAFDETDRLLESTRYLLGDEGPTRVDVTVAALLAPVCLPPEHLIVWPELDASLRTFQSEFEGRPTWDFVLRMYREHRRAA